jgi:hypothetical protein
MSSVIDFVVQAFGTQAPTPQFPVYASWSGCRSGGVLQSTACFSLRETVGSSAPEQRRRRRVGVAPATLFARPHATMIGHGRPSSVASACAGTARHAVCCARRRWLRFAHALLALLLIWAVGVVGHAQQTLTEEPIRLRITWGGGPASHWFGRVQLDDGPLENLKLLGMAADGAGSIWIENGSVQIATLSPRKTDGIEVTARWRAETKLRIGMSPKAGEFLPQGQVTLADLRMRPYVLRLDDLGTTLRVEAVPQQKLVIAFDRDPPIFVPGEQLSFEMQIALPDLVPGTTLDIQTTLTPARRDEALWNQSQRTPVPVDGAPRAVVNVPLPNADGVYKVRVAALRPSGFRDRFLPGATAPLAERTFQVVVLADRPALNLQAERSIGNSPPESDDANRWEMVLEIDPANPRWWERMPTWARLNRIPGLNHGPMGSLRAGTIDHKLGRFVELPSTPLAGDAHWQAYSLPLENVGLPHLLEVEYLAADEQHLGLSVVEPNAAGTVEGLGRDGGVHVEGFGRVDGDSRMTHRLLFWPRTQAPLLLVTNQHPTAPARFGIIRVLKAKDGRLNPGRTVPPAAERMVATYSGRPLLPEALGATKQPQTTAAESALPPVLHDWHTFYESATRLAEYVHYGGYNSAVVNVLDDGSSIYPSSSLLPTPLHNSARLTDEPREPDALQLLLQVFDREGLSLVPALQFTAPLPVLEELRRNGNPHESGLEWVGADGRTWLATHGSPRGLAPYYNLLDPRVQQAMLQVADELVARYRHHPSLAGVAVQLSAAGYAQLPSLEWGFDDATVARFEGDTGIKLTAKGEDRFAARHAILTGEYAEKWRSWRALQVTQFYEQLASLVRTSGNGRRLFITLESTLDHPQLAARARPNLLAENSVESLLLDLGIQRKDLESVPGLVLCPVRFSGSRSPLPDKAVEFELNEAAAGWNRQRDTAATTATLIYQRPQRRPLPSFKERSPFQLSGDTTLLLRSMAHQAAAGKPYVQALLEDDPEVVLDGGEILPLGQRSELRRARSILRQLPVGAEVSQQTGQPVTVRSYAAANYAVLIMVNASPWRTKTIISLDVPQETPLEPLQSESGELLSSVAARPLPVGLQTLSVSLPPYAIEAVRVATPGVTVGDVQAQISSAGLEELAAALTDLANRDLTAPRSYEGLANPGFEPLSGTEAVPGWAVTDGGIAVLDAIAPHHGKSSLYLEAARGMVAIESNSFPVPATGQLAMTLYARGQHLDPRTELRVVVEAESAGSVFRRSFVVGGAAAGQVLKSEWQSYAVAVNDLPLDASGKMRLRFTLVGAGEVWLDHISLDELLFPLSWYNKNEKLTGRAEMVQFIKLIHASRAAFDAGRISDCVHLLEGYWPRFLIAYTAHTQSAIAAEPAQKQQAASPPADPLQEPPPSVSEKLKRLVPFLR